MVWCGMFTRRPCSINVCVCVWASMTHSYARHDPFIYRTSPVPAGHDSIPCETRFLHEHTAHHRYLLIQQIIDFCSEVSMTLIQKNQNTGEDRGGGWTYRTRAQLARRSSSSAEYHLTCVHVHMSVWKSARAYAQRYPQRQFTARMQQREQK